VNSWFREVWKATQGRCKIKAGQIRTCSTGDTPAHPSYAAFSFFTLTGRRCEKLSIKRPFGCRSEGRRSGEEGKILRGAKGDGPTSRCACHDSFRT
jgi:hypothetical protein